MYSVLFTVPYLLTNQNIVCERAYGDETGQKLVKNEDTTGSCSMQEGNAREKLDYGKPDGVRNYLTVRN